MNHSKLRLEAAVVGRGIGQLRMDYVASGDPRERQERLAGGQESLAGAGLLEGKGGLDSALVGKCQSMII